MGMFTNRDLIRDRGVGGPISVVVVFNGGLSFFNFELRGGCRAGLTHQMANGSCWVGGDRIGGVDERYKGVW